MSNLVQQSISLSFTSQMCAFNSKLDYIKVSVSVQLSLHGSEVFTRQPCDPICHHVLFCDVTKLIANCGL